MKKFMSIFGLLLVSLTVFSQTALGPREIIEDQVNFSGSGAILLPSGTSGERPSSPVAGQIRYNTTLGNIEIYRAGVWTLPLGTNEFPDNDFKIFDDADNTKEMIFELSGITSSSSRTFTAPNQSGTFALIDADQTYTGVPTFNNAIIASSAATFKDVATFEGQLISQSDATFQSAASFASPVTFESNASFTGTGAVALPSGNDSERPSTAIEGMIRFNSSSSTFEGYASSSWGALATGIASGGSSTDNAIVRWDGAGGSTAQDSSVLIDDSDNVSGINNLTVGGASTFNSDVTFNSPSSFQSTATFDAPVDINSTSTVDGIQTHSVTPVFSAGFDSNDVSTIDASGASDALAVNHNGTGDALSVTQSGAGLAADINGNADISGTLDVTGAATFTDLITASSAVSFAEIATPTTPSSGIKIYAKSDNKLYQLTDDGTETELGAGSGGEGGINYIDSNDIEGNLDGYLTFDDASAYVDGTGGGATDTTTTNLTLVRNTTTPLRGTGDLKLTQGAADSRYEGFSYDFTIDKGQQGEMLTGSFWYDASDADYVDDDIRIFIYDVTNSQIIRVNGEDIKGGKGTHYFQWQAANDSDSYRLSYMVNQSNTNGYDIYFDQIAVSPTRLARGAIVTEWEDETGISLGNVTTSSIQFKSRRVGGNLEVMMESTVSAAPSSAILITLSDYVIDTTKASSDQQAVGIATAQDVGTALYDGNVAITSSQELRVYSTSTGNWQATVPFSWVSGDKLSATFSVPIQGWASSGTLSEDLGGGDVVVRGAGNSGLEITANTERIDFTQVEDTANAWSTTDNGTDTFTATSTGYYLFLGNVEQSTSAAVEIRSYIDGSASKRIGNNSSSSNPRIPFDGVEYLIKGQTLDFRPTGTITLSNDTNDHWIHIQKLNSGQTFFKDANMSCETKYLTADVTTNTDPISDLTSPLEIGKKYSLSSQLQFTSSGSDLRGSVIATENSATLARHESSFTTSSEFQTGELHEDCFTAGGTSLTFSTSSQGTWSLLGNNTTSETWVKVCRLPNDTVCN